MKMIRNNETGVEFPATEQLLKRVYRETSSGQKGKWTVFNTEGDAPAKKADKPAPAPEKDEAPEVEAAEVEQEEAPEVEQESEASTEDDDGLGEIRAKVIAQIESTDDIQKAVDRKRALAEIALENFAMKVNQREAVDKIRADVMAVATGEAEAPPLDEGEDD